MDKKSKDVLRRYKKTRQAQSSSSSTESDSGSSSSYSSSDSERKERHRKKKARQAAGSSRRSSSSSAEERRKREKREHCQKKLEAKRNHLKRKLKEAKLKKRAAAAAAALSGHSHRSLSPATQAKLKKLAERKHLRAASKERREREKHRVAREREREHHHGTSRSPTKITKIRIHQDVKRQKSPQRVHHQLMSREKIIIQTRTRDRTPSVEHERQRHEQKVRHEEMTRDRERRERERERAEREAARDKERAEALARCQERQRERERIAREKLRREEEEKKYGGAGLAVDRGDRLLPRPGEREIAIAAARGYNSRERSLEHHVSKRDMDVYERDYLEAERRGLIDREELRREREYMVSRRRDLSPVAEHYAARMRDPRDLYPDEERDRVYNRAYLEESRHPRERDPWLDHRDLPERPLHDPRDFRDMEHDLMYGGERERIAREHDRSIAARGEWKGGDWDTPRERDWDNNAQARGGFVGGPKRGGGAVGAAINIPPKIVQREQRASSEPDWDDEENTQKAGSGPNNTKVDVTPHRNTPPTFGGGAPTQRDSWVEHDQRDKVAPNARIEMGGERRWQNDWREGDESGLMRGSAVAPGMMHHHRGGRPFRRGGGIEHGERNPGGGGFRPHPPPLMTLPVQPPQAGGVVVGPPGVFHSGGPRFPVKRSMTYTNPTLIKKQQVALAAAKAAAQASAVAAASTAVAAAKAAAQSAANSITNPGILGQVSSALQRQQQLLQQQPQSYIVIDDNPEAGEIVNDVNKAAAPPIDLGAKSGPLTTNTGATSTSANVAATEEKAVGELSEISDSDDEILNKTDKKPSKADNEESLSDPIAKSLPQTVDQDHADSNLDAAGHVDSEKVEAEDEMLDFEEISDGELEEDARNKVGVGDALGVDWASLIAETKRHAENPTLTTAKQKWQPHRVILDIGISMRMAGEEYAKRLLSDAKQKLDEELGQLRIKSEIKDELSSVADDDSLTHTVDTTDENTNDTVATVTVATANGDVKKLDIKPLTLQKHSSTEDDANTEVEVEQQASSAINVERLHPLACVQVGERKSLLEQQKLIMNACGPNSRALSARRDLKLRRQLCGLPARECDFPRPIPATSDKLKAMAVAAFQRALEVK